MNKKVSIISVAMMLLTLTSVTSCDRGNQDISINNEKTQLYVGVYEGGLKSGSLYKIAGEFEKKYENIGFEDGKTGVEVVFLEGRYGNKITDTIADSLEDVYFDTAASSLYLHSNNQLLDISELYNTPMNYDFVTKTTSSNESSQTFYDLVRSDRRDYYKAKDDGKFYGYPGYSQYFGITYDIDMFEEYNLYFSKNGGFVKSKDEPRLAGPDNDFETTFDNGLPQTYDEFFTLCDKIVSLNMTPIMWGGTVQEYVNSLLTALAADYDGKEQTELNYNYDGVATSLVKEIDANGKIVLDDEATKISAKNGYELYRQAGRYYALSFLNRLVSNKDYYNYLDATSPSFSNIDAQDQYLASKRNSRKRTAMLIEGSWWNNEASGTFLSMAAEYGESDSQINRRFGMLPFPKATKEKVGEKFTTIERATGDGFINANIPEYKKDLALSFIQHMFKKESYLTCLSLDCQTRAVEYTLTDNEYNSLNSWAKAMYDLKANATTATMYSNSDIMKLYSSELWYSPNLWNSTVNGTTYTYPSSAMINYQISAKSYFEGLAKYMNKGVWESKFSSVI